MRTGAEKNDECEERCRNNATIRLYESYRANHSMSIKNLMQKTVDFGISTPTMTFMDKEDLVTSILRHEWQEGSHTKEANVSPLFFNNNILVDVKMLEKHKKDRPLRLIFLDVDGVLNTTETTCDASNNAKLEHRCIKTFVKLLNETDSCIVLSSSWRHSLLSKLILVHVMLDAGMDSSKWVGQTPSVSFHSRPQEILQWFSHLRETYPDIDKVVESWIILDDIDFFSESTIATEEMKNRFIWVDSEFGLCEETAADAKSLLMSE